MAIIYTNPQTGVETDRFEEHGCDVRKQLCPDGWVEVDIYTPHSCPWDCYGNKRLREMRAVLKAANIESLALTTNKTLLHPTGSGRGGAVRFGDNMTPGTYRTAVKAALIGKAQQAMTAHKRAIWRWIDGEGEMPAACR